MTEAVVGIEPTVLKWARESSGLSIDDVALSLKREPGDVLAWESGDAAPTYAQLESLAYKMYKRPIATFFLPGPPQEPSIKKEFRTLPDFELDQLAADTRYQLRLAYAFQISLAELNDGVNPVGRKIFVDLPLSAKASVVQSAQRIRAYLEISLDQQFRWKSDEDALKAWRNAIEGAGVFVFKHSFKQDQISGFCLVDEQFPVIYLNNSTSKTRQIFTLFHELVHVLLHVNSISVLDDSYIDQLPATERRIERFCNAVTAELLLPSEDFNARTRNTAQVTLELISGLARRYHVSREVVLRRLADSQRVDQKFYQRAVDQWKNEAEARAGESSGGDYYATPASYLGDRYLQLVFGKHYQGRLSLEQVADYLGVRTKSVSGLENMMLRKASSS